MSRYRRSEVPAPENWPCCFALSPALDELFPTQLPRHSQFVLATFKRRR